MTRQEFEQRLDDLIDEYICENDDYEDVCICHTTSWRQLPDEWMIDVAIEKQKKRKIF